MTGGPAAMPPVLFPVARTIAMTIGQLIERLQAVVARDPRNADLPVTFGGGMEPVEGGTIGRNKGGMVLNLAPLPLDRVGGF
jgi:hypothetical protein